MEICQGKNHSADLRNEASDLIVAFLLRMLFPAYFLSIRNGHSRRLKQPWRNIQIGLCFRLCHLRFGESRGPSAPSFPQPCSSPVGLSLVRIMCFRDKRLWSILTEHSENPWKVRDESVGLADMPKNGFSPRAVSIITSGLTTHTFQNFWKDFKEMTFRNKCLRGESSWFH